MGTCLEGRHRSESESTITFLNQSKKFAEPVDWQCKEMPKLWRYNLHYFDYLQDPGRPLDNKWRLISNWIERNPPGTDDAWEPYTASLRIVNWVKFFLSLSSDLPSCQQTERQGRGAQALPKAVWLESLYLQALWLERNIEYHILANHYLKNGVALFFAGVYFDGPDADRWIKKGMTILREELDEQFLPDGGHFERSPMYHSICLVDYLDVLNLIHHSQVAFSSDGVEHITERVRDGLSFLKEMSLPDNQISLFNDSAFGIAPTPDEIFSYAKQVMGYQASVTLSGLRTSTLPASGYYVCRHGNDAMIIDCGSIGPDYQPGHAHCDALSFELAFDGRRVMVDSGVFDYEASPERTYARSTRAHNTVVVDGEEQSEIWGVFRVARRARPIQAGIETQPDGSVLFTGVHDGYRRLPGSPMHKRTILFNGAENWTIEDLLEGRGHHRMESYVHIHPDFQVVQDQASFCIADDEGRSIALVESHRASEVRIEKGWYFPEFGLKRENTVLVFTCSGSLPLSLRYRIHKVSSTSQGNL